MSKSREPAFSEEPSPFFAELRPGFDRFPLILALCAFIACVLFVDWGFGFLVSACVLFFVVWGLLHHIAPIAAKYLTTLGLIAVCLLSLTSIYLLQSRDNARRNHWLNELKEFGRETHERSATYPNYTKQLDRALKKKAREDPDTPLSQDFFDKALGFPSSTRDDR